MSKAAVQCSQVLRLAVAVTSALSGAKPDRPIRRNRSRNANRPSGQSEETKMARNSKANAGHRPGGGIASRQHVEKPVRTGQRAEAISEKGTSQIGSAMGNHATDGRRAVNPVERVRGQQR